MTSFEENHAFSQDESAQAAIENAAPEAYAEAAQASVMAPPADAADAPVPGAAFAALGLAPELVAAVTDLGYTQPTPVQLRTIPLALSGKADQGAFNDLMVSSQTGSGKTAAFLLPMLHTLVQQQHEVAAAEIAAWDAKVAEALANGEPAPKKPRRKSPLDSRHFKPAVPGALVLCPTRELAQQVASDAIDLVKHCRGLRVANVVGGMPYQLQIAKLQNANLVVATPGRLLDLQRSGQIKLDQIRFLVMDEADRMLDLGFADDLAEIHQLTAQRQQTMMFSATFAPRIQQLAMRVMHDNGARVQKVEIATAQEQHANIRQELYWADSPEHKRRLLDYWLRDPSIDQAIVFACTQVECEELAEDLQQNGFAAVSLHGALSQSVRNRRLGALRDGRVQILVATDVAARGIDVPTITHVINFGLPMKAEDYTHRIGRTGRAGRDGLAVTLAEFRDRRRLGDIEAHTRQPFNALTIDGLEPTRFFPPIQEAFGRKGAGKGRPGGRGAPRGGPRGSFGEDRRGPRMVGGGFGERSGDGARRPGAGSSHFGSGKPAPAHAKHGARPAARNGAPAPRAAKPYAPKGR
ncbi:DEAD/DEAH box helicase [Ottowia oryzae]|uniref:DEAD/DEAH box helicase n=1 Tax=Ottowia oryzae TaxID=2109914 RepID=A0A2S0MHR0_9BURK|nr:DEAD/DEAH box helicase [Ottowia oryzae]